MQKSLGWNSVMDFLPDIETFSIWLLHYGSFVLFILLALGIIALPVPEETLMVLSGILMSQGHLFITSTIIAAFLGSVFGITVSYLIGRTAGFYVITKYGSWIGITKTQIEVAHGWFERFGKWALFVGYFIPGVRHLTGFTAGTTYLEYSKFALFAYAGALIWVATFLSLGYFFGAKWLEVLKNIEITGDDIVLAVILVAIGLGIFLLRKKWK